MKNKILLILFIVPFIGCKNRQVEREKTKYEEVKILNITDTIFIEKIVENKVIIHDTIFKKAFDFRVEGKPIFDPVTGKLIPLTWDYSVFNGKDSIRTKGFMSGDGSINSKVDWEKKYNNLLQLYNSKDTKKEKKDSTLVTTSKFQQAKEKVQSQGYSLELLIYSLAGVAALFYLLGFFSPKIFAGVKNYLKTKIPFL